MEAGFRVILPDQRGYNLSEKPKRIKKYRIEELVKDIPGLIDALAYEKVNLVGHDWGVIVAWYLAYQHPDRLRRLGILNVPHPLVFCGFITRDFEQMRRSWYAFFFQLPWLPEMGMYAGDWRGMVRALRGSGKIHTFSDEDIVRYKESWSQPGAMTAILMVPGGALSNQTPQGDAGQGPDTDDVGRKGRGAHATHWVQHDAAEEANHSLIDFLLDRTSKQAIR